jgi:hypothetical protein
MRTVIIAYISIGSQIFENRSHITYLMTLISVEVRICFVENCHENRWAVTKIDSMYLGVIRGFFKIHNHGSQKPKNGCLTYNHGSLNMW